MIWTLGSINADYFYRLPHLVRPGETLAATSLTTGLGGKGANQSVAAARAGAQVHHIGAVGPDGQWAIDRLANFGVETTHIRIVDVPTAHAIVMIDEAGENQIVIFPGANRAQDTDAIEAALHQASARDWLMLQNETSHQVEAARIARARGMQVAYSAAPFDAGAVQAVLPHVDLLIMNAVEAAQLSDGLGKALSDIPVSRILITKGANGADWIDRDSGETVSVPAFPVDPVDTTGAGDTFAGYTVAGLALGLPPAEALTRAAAASALAVTKEGTADAIPSLQEVLDFLA